MPSNDQSANERRLHDREYRAARRAAARVHHPDVGGDAAALQAALDALKFDALKLSSNPVVVVRTSRRRRILKKLRSRIGRRTYIEIQ